MDKHELKAGDKAMLLVTISNHNRDCDGEIRVHGARENNVTSYVSPTLLHPLPAPAPLTEAERRVVEAAKAWRKGILIDHPLISVHEELEAAIDALAPPDPVAQLRKAFNEYRREMTAEAWKRALEAIVAVEKAIAK